MMSLSKRSICVASACLVPFFTLVSPAWLSLLGIAPCWSVLWLLPWSLEEGPLSAVLAGLCLGLVMDGITVEGFSQVPGLIAIGFWWGRIGQRSPKIDGIFSLGLFACIGTFFLGISIWVQIVALNFEGLGTWLNAWALKTVLSQSLVTGLVAPMICSWLILLWRRRFYI